MSPPVELSAEHLVLTQFAFEASVVERRAERRLESDLVEAFFAVAKHPCVVTRKVVFELAAYHLVEAKQVGSRDALAVRGIGDDDSFLRGLLEVGKVLLLDGDSLAQASRFDVGRGDGNSIVIDVVAVDVMLELMLA